MTIERAILTAAAVVVVLAGCSTGTDDTTTTAELGEPPVSPAEVVFEAQTSDGATIVVASVTLPAAGFIAVHGNSDGAPGPVVGHSDLLPEGTSTGVSITLDEPLTQSDLLFPMAHIDIDRDGVYEFFPPDNTVDGPALTSSGDVAVVGAEVTVGG